MKKQLLIVTDLGSFKAYSVDYSALNATPRLELIEHFHPEEPRIADSLSKLAGRYRAPGARGGATWGERNNIDLEERKRLIRRLSGRLNALMGDGAVDSCYFAASKGIDHQILDSLTRAAHAKIKKNLPADLIKASKEKLLDYFGLRAEKRTAPVARVTSGVVRPLRTAR